jgi:hypothetical protein
MLRPMEEGLEEEKPARKLDGRKLAVLGIAAAVAIALALAGWFAWKGHKQKLDETAIFAAVTDTTLMLRELLAKPSAAAELAPRINAHLATIKAASRTQLAEVAEEYVLGAREIARRRGEVAGLARQAERSRDAAFAHLAAGKHRGDGWFKAAAELKKRMERDYTELNISLKTLDTLLSGMPETVKRAAPLFGDKLVVPASEFNAAAQQAQEDLKRVALELERARQLPIN